jgi:hypothetical protein
VGAPTGNAPVLMPVPYPAGQALEGFFDFVPRRPIDLNFLSIDFSNFFHISIHNFQ